MSDFIVISIALNLLFLLASWVFITKRGGFSYIAKHLLRRQPPLHSYRSPYYFRHNSQFEQLTIDTDDIVLLGDSLTDEGQWSELLAGFSIKNRGIGGDTTDGLLARIDSILAAQPKTIFLMIGINDLMNEEKTPTDISQNYERILTRIKTGTPSTTVFLQSILPTNYRLHGRKADREIRATNAQLQQLAQQFSYTYIDLFSTFADPSDQLDEQYTIDGVHLNGLGYQKWQQILQSYL